MPSRFLPLPSSSLIPNEDLKRKYLKATSLYSSVITCIQLAERLKGYYDQYYNFTIKILSNDPAYNDIHSWMLTLIPVGAQKAIVAKTKSRTQPWEFDDDDDDENETRVKPGVSFLNDDTRQHTVLIGGHKVKVKVYKGENEYDGRRTIADPDAVIFTCRNKDAANAVVDEVRRIQQERTAVKRKSRLHTLDGSGGWGFATDTPPRTLGSVTLAKGQKERIVTDVQTFLDSERDYLRRGIPWHRGYLFHGAAGVGKTSLSRALASDLGLDIWYVSLGDISNDANLTSILSQVSARSILLLEDIDVFSASHDRIAEKGALSLSGLLNGLDGIITPHGLITIMTSNRVEELDPALLRPGRIDLVEEIGFPDDEQLGRMFKTFYGIGGGEMRAAGRSSAALMEIMKQHMNDPDGAVNELRYGDFSIPR